MRCPSCPGPDCPQVYSSGPVPCPVLFIGAGPGQRESRTGIPYSGQAGEEFDRTYLPLARLHRSEIHTANATLCYSGDDKVPPDARVQACARFHLPRLLDRVKPELVVLMGGATCRISDTRLRLDMHHGRPVWTSILGGEWEGWVWASYEPALGMRETAMMTGLLDDFRNLGLWREGEWTPPQTEEVEKDYKLAKSADEVRNYFEKYT